MPKSWLEDVQRALLLTLPSQFDVWRKPAGASFGRHSLNEAAKMAMERALPIHPILPLFFRQVPTAASDVYSAGVAMTKAGWLGLVVKVHLAKKQRNIVLK